MEQVGQRFQMVLAEVGDGVEIRGVIGRQHPEGMFSWSLQAMRLEDPTPVRQPQTSALTIVPRW